MTDPKLVCPHCSVEIHLTESLAAPLLATAKAQFQKQLLEKDAQIVERETAILKQEQALLQEKRTLQETVQAQLAEALKTEREQICLDEAANAKRAAALELEAAQKQTATAEELLKANERKLTEAQQSQVEFLKKQRELEDEKRELDLTVEKRIHAGLVEVQERAKKEAEEKLTLKVSEKDQMISALQKQVENMARKIEQGSQQMQGEILELELEMLLRTTFPADEVLPVPKGEFGGDVLQRLSASDGSVCGSILWEFKRTKNWSNGWLMKLRNDQRVAKAEIAVLVGTALPEGVELCDLIDGVWVIHPRAIVSVATLLRQSLLQVATARRNSDGRQTKTELVYEYLTGSQFRRHMEALVEAFSAMRSDLQKERQMMLKQWSKREKQIDLVIAATGGMWGDLQGISGKSLQELDGFDIPVELDTDADERTQAALPGLI